MNLIHDFIPSLAFAVALALSGGAVTCFVANLHDGQPRHTGLRLIAASLAWGVFYYLTH